MSEQVSADGEARSLHALRVDLRKRLESLADIFGDEYAAVSAVLDDLVQYHDQLEKRERSLQSTLANLLEDMSQTSRTLNETGNRLDAILHAAKGLALVIVGNEEGNPILEFSRGAEEIFGYERSEILGHSLARLYPGEVANVCTLEDHSSLRTSMIRKNGEEFPAMQSCYPLHDSAENHVNSLIIVMDNSRHEMTQKLIRESNERYMALALAAPVSILTFDHEGTITFVNDWHMRMVDRGTTHEYFLGKKVFDLPPVIYSGTSKKLRTVMDGKPVHMEDVHVPAYGGKKGGWYNVRLSPLVKDGVFSGGILILEDVTRRKRTELELKMLIDNSPIPLLKVEQTEKGGIIRSLNPVAAAMFGRQALNSPIENYLKVLVDDGELPEKVHGERCEVQTKSGVRQVIRTTHQPGGRFEVQAIMDVTVLIEAKEAAEDASRSKSDFIANISHEIRTPLNVLLGMLQLFSEEDLSDDLAEMVEHATGAANSLLALLNDILDFTVVEARAIALDVQEFDLREVIKLLITPYALEGAAKGVDLQYAIAEDVPPLLCADVRRLRQILFHVISNGIKFTDEGRVHVEAVWEQADDSQGSIHITVSDTGIGMSQEQMEHIFEPFRQGDGSRNRRHGGTGIGLAIVSEFVRAMGGSLTVESRPGKGSQFKFEVQASLPPC